MFFKVSDGSDGPRSCFKVCACQALKWFYESPSLSFSFPSSEVSGERRDGAQLRGPPCQELCLNQQSPCSSGAQENLNDYNGAIKKGNLPYAVMDDTHTDWCVCLVQG